MASSSPFGTAQTPVTQLYKEISSTVDTASFGYSKLDMRNITFVAKVFNPVLDPYLTEEIVRDTVAKYNYSPALYKDLLKFSSIVESRFSDLELTVFSFDLELEDAKRLLGVTDLTTVRNENIHRYTTSYTEIVNESENTFNNLQELDKNYEEQCVVNSRSALESDILGRVYNALAIPKYIVKSEVDNNDIPF